MRNLKRALSLALASVMLLGMMVVGTGASYADVDSADNVEAIEVMQAIGVMSGDDKGNFNPDQKVTRGEMAVVMANLLGLQVKDFVGASIPFTDVPEWATAYVAACYADGITAGISATEYGFNYEVTTAQAALMMMKALGYFQNAKDFGSDWQVATVKQGSIINLFDGIEAGATTAMTRNEVAKIALNTLQATMVETDGTNTTITTGDVTINTGDTKYVEVEKAGKAYTAISGTYDASDLSKKYTVQLGEELFDGDLKLNASVDHDVFGAPANVWTYKDFTGKYAKDAILTYTDEVKPSDLVDDLEDAGYKIDKTSSETSLTVWSNGDGSETYVGTAVASAITTNTAFGAKGVELKVYDKDGDDVADTIVMTYTYAAKVTSITEDDEDTKADERKIAVTAYMDGKAEADDIVLDKDTIGFDAVYSNVEEDDIVLVTPKADATSATASLSVAIPETVTGIVSQVTTGKSAVLGGTKYALNKYVAGTTLAVNADDEQVFYLDSFGNVIYVSAVETVESADVVFVTAAYKGTGTWGTTDMFQGVLADGTVITGEYKYEGTLGDNLNKAYTYTKDGDVYELTDASIHSVTDKVGAKDLNKAEISDSDKKVAGNYFASEVTFVYVTGEKDDIKVTVKNGIQNVASGTVSYGVVGKDSGGKYVVTTVFVASNAINASEDLIFVAEAWTNSNYTDTKLSDDNKSTLYGYEAYLNGEQTTIYISKSDKDALSSSKAVGFYSYTVNETTGAYSVESKAETTGVTTSAKPITVVNVNGKYYASIDTLVDYDATNAKVIDTTDDGKVISISKLEDASKNAWVIFDKDAETISYIYVVA